MNIFDHFSSIINTNNPIIMEFGACDGTHTDILCKILKNNGASDFQYHAFEPHVGLTKSFLKKNKIHFPNVKYVSAAIAAVDGEIVLHVSSGEETRAGHLKQSFHGSSSIKEPDQCSVYWPDMKFHKTRVKAYRFDTYCKENGINQVDFVWADVQGAERDMILGGMEAFSRTRYLYTELTSANQYADPGYENVHDLIKLLPGKWSIVEQYPADVLLKNEALA